MPGRLASRRPAHPVGWLLLGIGLLVPVSGITYGYARYGLVARPAADTLTAELLAVVEQTMQPTSVSLWLRPSVSARNS